jgi:hypothetical protein
VNLQKDRFGLCIDPLLCDAHGQRVDVHMPVFLSMSAHNESYFCSIVLGHASCECSTEFLVAFRSDMFQFLSAHTSTFEFIEDGGEMNRYEAVGSRGPDELIKEVVGVVMNKF